MTNYNTKYSSMDKHASGNYSKFFVSPQCLRICSNWLEVSSNVAYIIVGLITLLCSTQTIETPPTTRTFTGRVAPAARRRSRARLARPSRTTSWTRWSRASSDRSTSACRTAWSSRPNSTSQTRKSRHGTRTAGQSELLTLFFKFKELTLHAFNLFVFC